MGNSDQLEGAIRNSLVLLDPTTPFDLPISRSGVKAVKWGEGIVALYLSSLFILPKEEEDYQYLVASSALKFNDLISWPYPISLINQPLSVIEYAIHKDARLTTWLTFQARRVLIQSSRLGLSLAYDLSKIAYEPKVENVLSDLAKALQTSVTPENVVNAIEQMVNEIADKLDYLIINEWESEPVLYQAINSSLIKDRMSAFSENLSGSGNLSGSTFQSFLDLCARVQIAGLKGELSMKKVLPLFQDFEYSYLSGVGINPSDVNEFASSFQDGINLDFLSKYARLARRSFIRGLLFVWAEALLTTLRKAYNQNSLGTECLKNWSKRQAFLFSNWTSVSSKESPTTDTQKTNPLADLFQPYMV